MVGLVKFDNPILREAMPDDIPDDFDQEKFETEIIETMKANKLFSLAANEIGWRIRAFGIGDFTAPIVLYFPTITATAPTFKKEIEKVAIFGKSLSVKRPEWIRCRYSDGEGTVHVNAFDGLTARLMHRAINQLDGLNTYLTASVTDRLRSSGLTV